MTFLQLSYPPYKGLYETRRIRLVKKGKKKNVHVVQSYKYDEYVKLLSDVLKKYHDATPVHTGAELKMLAERFPENIKLYTGEVDGKILAGAVVFENGDTVHTQYLANSDEGRNIGALDCVIDYLLSDVYADKKKKGGGGSLPINL